VVKLLITNHLDQSLWWANQKHWAAVRSYLLNSFLQVHSAAAPFTSHGNTHNYAEPKPFSWAKRAYFGFSSSNFIVQDHIESTIGDALTTCCENLVNHQQDLMNFISILFSEHSLKPRKKNLHFITKLKRSCVYTLVGTWGPFPQFGSLNSGKVLNANPPPIHNLPFLFHCVQLS
jgi:hypothetical protein